MDADEFVMAVRELKDEALYESERTAKIAALSQKIAIAIMGYEYDILVPDLRKYFMVTIPRIIANCQGEETSRDVYELALRLYM